MKQKTNITKEICVECKTVHTETAICDCGACLYANAKQMTNPLTEQDKKDLNVESDDLTVADFYPMVKCKCGRHHFWD